MRDVSSYSHRELLAEWDAALQIAASDSGMGHVAALRAVECENEMNRRNLDRFKAEPPAREH